MAHVSSNSQPDGPASLEISPLFGSAPLAVCARYVAAIAMTAIASVVAIGVDSRVMIPNVSLIFVVPVIVSAINFGLGASLCSAVLGALAYNFFLTEPRYTLMVDDPANIWAIGLLFVIGLIVSGVAFTSRNRAAEAALLRQQTVVLQAYSREICTAQSPKEKASVACKALAALFRVPAVAGLVGEDSEIVLEQSGGLQLEDAEFGVACATVTSQVAARAGIYPDLTSRLDFWPVVTATGQRAFLGVAFDPNERPSAPDVIIDVVGNVLALALDLERKASNEKLA